MKSLPTVIRLSLVAVFPLLMIQWAFLFNDPYQIGVSLAYGLLPIVLLFAIVLLSVYLAIETTLRGRYMQGIRKTPWFTIAAALGLVAFLPMINLATPIVLKVPSWCRASQTVEIPMSNGRQFILVCAGRGNASQYRFGSGYLNYTGDAPAGISDMRFGPMRFGHWEGHEHHFAPGSREELDKRIRLPDIPKDEMDSVGDEIWRLLEDAENGVALQSDVVDTGTPWASPFGNHHYIIGGIIWVIGMTLSFIGIGIATVWTHGTVQ